MPRQPYSVTLQGSGARYTSMSGGSPAETWTGTAAYASESFSGVARRKPTGWIPPTAYTFNYTRWEISHGTCLSYYVPWPALNTQRYEGLVGGGLGRFNTLNHWNDTSAEPSFDPSLMNAALTAARLKLKRKKVDLGVAFGERKQTSNLVAKTASRLTGAVRRLRRGEIRGAMNALGIRRSARQPRSRLWSNNWLELQYGWKPLLSDVFGACEALSKRPASDWRVTAKGVRSRKQIATRTFWSWDAGVYTAECDIVAFVRIDAMPQNDAIMSLASLGVTNPLTVGWELLPYSFVVDWFIPIGQYLDSLDASFGFGSAYTSSTHFIKGEWKGAGLSIRSGDFQIENDYRDRKRIVRLQRTVSNGIPMPGLPSFKDPRSLGHMSNALALLAGAFGRRVLYKR